MRAKGSVLKFGATLMSRSVALALIIAVIFCVQIISAHAQGGACGDAPVVDDIRFKGELDSKAQFLSRFIGDAQFKGQIDYAKDDVLKKYPNADKLRINQ